LGVCFKLKDNTIEVYETKLGEFRAVPTSDPNLYAIEKKYLGLDSIDWIEFGIMKLNEFKEFIKANKKT